MNTLKKISLILFMLFLRNFYVLAQPTRDNSAVFSREEVLDNTTDTIQEVSFERGTAYYFPKSNGNSQSVVLDSMWAAKDNKCPNCLIPKGSNAYTVFLPPREKGFKVVIQYICKNPGFSAPRESPKPSPMKAVQMPSPEASHSEKKDNVRTNEKKSRAILGIEELKITKPFNTPDFDLYRDVLKKYIKLRIGCLTILDTGLTANVRFFPSDPDLYLKNIEIKVKVGSVPEIIIQMSKITMKEISLKEEIVIKISANLTCEGHYADYVNFYCQHVPEYKEKQQEQKKRKEPPTKR